MTQTPRTDTRSGVESGEAIPAVRRFAAAASDALALGVSREQLMNILTDDISGAVEERPRPALPSEGEYPVYAELPDGLIDLPSAARRYGVNRVTLWRWADRGSIKIYGRLKGSAAGGGYLLLNEEELRSYISAPRNKGGRPKKSM